MSNPTTPAPAPVTGETHDDDEEEAADMLFEGGRLGPAEVNELERDTATDFSWARGAKLLFHCALCGATQAAAPPGAHDGVSADEAEARGWRIGDGSTPSLCPRCEKRIDGETADQVKPLDAIAEAPPPRTRKVWRGHDWVQEPIPEGEDA